MQIWNAHHELDQASISNFKAPGLKMNKGNCSLLFIISDVWGFEFQPPFHERHSKTLDTG